MGLEAIASGVPLRALDPPLFTGMLTGFVDKNSGLETRPSSAHQRDPDGRLHADGTFKSLSEKYFGIDYATNAGNFDLA